MMREEREKYCYPFKEYDPSGTTTTNGTSASRNTNNTSSRANQNSISGRPVVEPESFLQMSGIRRATLSQSTGLRLLGMPESLEHNCVHGHPISPQNDQNVPPPPSGEPPPLPPRRSTSLLHGPGSSSTLTLLRLPKPRESSSLNPKRVSIATSTFWTGHPDMANFSSGWDVGRESMRTHSVWGTTERGGRPVTESVDIWGDPPAVKKGILLQQREKLWSRWKERYFILTRDYFNCFRRTTSVHRSGLRLSEMGSFIYKLRLAEVDGVEWESRKNGCLIALVLPQEPRILLRVTEDNYETLHQWYTLLQECIYMSKERRRALRTQHGSMPRSTISYNPSCNKSLGSSSPHSSSKSASNSDLDKSLDGEVKSCGKGDLQSSVRSSSGPASRPPLFKSSPSPRSLLRNRKYSPLLDDDELELLDGDGDYQHAIDDLPPGVQGSTDKGQEEFTVTLRRRREILRNPNEINNNHQHPKGFPGGSFSKSSVPSVGDSGYAVPIDARPCSNRQRPDSWTPQPTVFYRTSSLVHPNQWTNKRELHNGNRATPFGRSSVLCYPSRTTADVTFRKI